jgi:hypothetical protein
MFDWRRKVTTNLDKKLEGLPKELAAIFGYRFEVYNTIEGRMEGN